MWLLMRIIGGFSKTFSIPEFVFSILGIHKTGDVASENEFLGDCRPAQVIGSTSDRQHKWSAAQAIGRGAFLCSRAPDLGFERRDRLHYQRGICPSSSVLRLGEPSLPAPPAGLDGWKNRVIEGLFRFPSHSFETINKIIWNVLRSNALSIQTVSNRMQFRYDDRFKRW